MDITLNYIFYPHENTYNDDKKCKFPSIYMFIIMEDDKTI